MEKLFVLFREKGTLQNLMKPINHDNNTQQALGLIKERDPDYAKTHVTTGANNNIKAFLVLVLAVNGHVI